MPADVTPAVILLALVLDAVFGYPQSLVRKIGHPVMWIGALVERLDAALNRPDWSVPARRLVGGCALLAIVAVPAAIAAAVEYAVSTSAAGPLPVAALAGTLLAGRSLYDHVRDVADALETEGLDAGRRAVSKIVGRDPHVLDRHGVARAAIESLAENASDGIVAPVVWFALLGLPGLAAYKAINTADSMIGHRTARHEAFGWAAARLDDLVNLPASRLTALLLIVASVFAPGASARCACRAVLRDARHHRSPNAGWPESAMAGALGLRLAGPRAYDGLQVHDAFMGHGRAEATEADIRRALRLATLAWLVTIAGLGAAAAIGARS
ncbi:MAG: adenosylcobinamide-phosphate synthase CbiB [Hyphomicrobiaceae bacterium]